MLTIIDMNNWFRRRAETVGLGSPLRQCFNEIQAIAGPVIGVWDGQGALAARRKIYPEYKAKRNKPADDFFKSQDLFKKIVTFSKARLIEVPGFEGDDVIAHIVIQALSSGIPHNEIFIQSNDADLSVLGTPMAREKVKVDAEYLTIYKTMVGDPSDNIPGAKQFGKKAWESLDFQQKDTLRHLILNGWGLTEAEIRARVESFYPKGGLEWFVKKENREALLTYHKVISFLPVPTELIDKHSMQGLNRPDLAQPIFQQFML